LIVSEVSCDINVKVIYFHGFKFKVVLNCGINNLSFVSNYVTITEREEKFLHSVSA